MFQVVRVEMREKLEDLWNKLISTVTEFIERYCFISIVFNLCYVRVADCPFEEPYYRH